MFTLQLHRFLFPLFLQLTPEVETLQRLSEGGAQAEDIAEDQDRAEATLDTCHHTEVWQYIILLFHIEL